MMEECLQLSQLQHNKGNYCTSKKMQLGGCNYRWADATIIRLYDPIGKSCLLEWCGMYSYSNVCYMAVTV